MEGPNELNRMALPHYYSSLGPFRELFRTGRPLLTYHHVGPRLSGAHIKGLYVSAKLFARQAAEFKDEGFSTPGFDNVLAKGPAGERVVFLTFDDGFCDVFENAMPVLQRHQFRAIEFLVADLLGKTSEWQRRDDDAAGPLMDAAQVKDWLAAGNEIGSHTLSHPHLTQIPIAQAREEIAASKKKLEDLFGRSVAHFCYPYGDWNAVVRDLVQEAGYRTACTVGTGLNEPGADPLALKRITARYPTRNWKAFWRWVGFGR